MNYLVEHDTMADIVCTDKKGSNGKNGNRGVFDGRRSVQPRGRAPQAVRLNDRAARSSRFRQSICVISRETAEKAPNRRRALALWRLTRRQPSSKRCLPGVAF